MEKPAGNFSFASCAALGRPAVHKVDASRRAKHRRTFVCEPILLIDQADATDGFATCRMPSRTREERDGRCGCGKWAVEVDAACRSSPCPCCSSPVPIQTRSEQCLHQTNTHKRTRMPACCAAVQPPMRWSWLCYLFGACTASPTSPLSYF